MVGTLEVRALSAENIELMTGLENFSCDGVEWMS